MDKWLFAFLFGIFWPLLAFTQTSHVDSLNFQAWTLRLENPVLARKLAAIACLEAQSIDYAKGIGDSRSRLGVIFENRGEYDSALVHHLAALSIRENYGDRKAVAGSCKSIGFVHQAMGNFELAEKYLFMSLEVRSELEEAYELGKSLLDIGNFFATQGFFGRAKMYYQKALKCFKKEDYKEGEAMAMNNLANLFYEKSEFDSALVLYQQSEVIHRLLNSTRGLASTLNNEAVICMKKREYTTAQKLLEESVSLCDSAQTLDILLDAYYNLHLVNRQRNDNLEALRYYELFDSLEYELFNIEKSNLMLDLQTRYETEKKERENVELRAANAEKDAAQKRQAVSILWLIIALIFVAAGGGFMYYRQRQKAVLAAKNEHIKQQEVDDLMQRQELTAMGAMMEGQEKERKRIAQDLHDRIGSQLAAVKLNMEALQDKVEKGQEEAREQFGKTYGLIDGLVDEVRKISHNMVSGVLMKFGLEAALLDLAEHITGSGKVKVDVHVFNLDERVDAHVEITIYRIVQELVANALKHAQGNAIAISLNRQDGNLNVMVEDNGKGFDLTKVKKGMGLENVRQRAATLDGELNIDARPGRGTTVIVDIPIA